MPSQMFTDPHMLTVIIVGWSVLGLIALWGGFLHWRRKTKVLTVKKTVILSLFLGFFLLQAYLSTVFSAIGAGGGQIPFSLNSVTVIVVGVLFGPVEGILYGLLADTLGVFIKGYSWDPLNALIYPIYGALSGIGREVYFKFKNRASKTLSFSLAQIPIWFITIAAFAVGTNQEALSRAGVSMWVPYTFGSITFVFLQSILLWFMRKDSKDKLFLLTTILFATVIGRVVGGWYIRSLAQTLWTSTPFEVLVLGRIITSSYMTPLNAVIAYWMSNASIYAMKVTDWKA